MNTWGISGPYFLLLYVGLLVITWIAVLTVRRGLAAGPAAVPGLPELGPYEVAMLNGGGRLALVVAACRLKDAGSIEVAGSALHPAGPLPADADPLEKLLYTHVEGHSVRASDLIDERSAEPVLASLRDHLRQLGLMPTARQTALMRWQVLWFVPLLALGVARVAAGTANHHPVLYLVLLMLLTVGVAVSLFRQPRALVSTSVQARLFLLPRVTSTGLRMLKGLSAQSAGDGVVPRGGFGGLAGAAVIRGVGAIALADAAFAATLGISSGSAGSGFYGGGGGCGGGGGGCGGGGGGCGG